MQPCVQRPNHAEIMKIRETRLVSLTSRVLISLPLHYPTWITQEARVAKPQTPNMLSTAAKLR